MAIWSRLNERLQAQVMTWRLVREAVHRLVQAETLDRERKGITTHFTVRDLLDRLDGKVEQEDDEIMARPGRVGARLLADRRTVQDADLERERRALPDRSLAHQPIATRDDD